MKNWLVLFSLAALGVGCSATNTVTMSVQEPAIVQLPSEMEHIGIINRSEAGEEVSAIKRVDEILSVEGLELDSSGIEYSIEGLVEELQHHDLFDTVEMPSAAQLENPSFGVLPAALSWSEVEDICREYELDGLFSLEFYDTDTQIDYQTEKVSVEGPLKLKVPALEHHVTVVTTIKTGWRIYDYRSRHVVDEEVITDQFTTSGKGVNPTKAVTAITGRNEAVKELSREIGQFYASRTLPFWTRVRRDYYVKGSDKLGNAKRRAQTGNWDGAAELWLDETESTDSKVAGRAHYNMAIINEINGDLESAVEWARTAYEDYGDKRALDYVRILDQRQRKLATLRQQEDE